MEERAGGALSGVRVLESTVQIAGPYCGRLLGELGCEVIKVEPLEGEASRRNPPFFDNALSLSYLYWNANKKSITLNLKEEKGKEIFLNLTKKSDVVLCNYRVGVMEKLGLGFESLKKINDQIIYASISGFGAVGPLKDYPGYDMVAQAMSGLADANGLPDGSPKVNNMSLDYSAAMMATTAILAALYHREKSGQGQSIDISLQDVGLIYAQHLIAQQMQGMNYRSGNRRLAFAPFSLYPTNDGYAVVALDEDKRWEAFLKSIGREDLLGDERFRTVGLRVENYDEIDRIVSEWTRGHDSEEVVAVVTKAGGASCPVKKISEVSSDEHLKARGMLGEMRYEKYEAVPYVGSALKLSNMPGKVETLGPSLGQHTDYVMKNLLGLNSDEIRILRDNRIIG